MCLACELDALWYAEFERLAAEGAGVAGTACIPPALSVGSAGVPPALAEEPVGAESGESAASPRAQTCEEAEDAGGTPAVPGAGGTPALRARPRFLCEETE
jgi:hypothetical protein